MPWPSYCRAMYMLVFLILPAINKAAELSRDRTRAPQCIMEGLWNLGQPLLEKWLWAQCPPVFFNPESYDKHDRVALNLAFQSRSSLRRPRCRNCILLTDPVSLNYPSYRRHGGIWQPTSQHPSHICQHCCILLVRKLNTSTDCRRQNQTPATLISPLQPRSGL